MQTVILAAGKGIRMRHLTKNNSKGMVELADKPMLEVIVDRLEPVSDEIILVVNRKQKDIQEHFGRSKKIKFAYQEKPLGTANALAAAEPLIRDRFIMINGDELIPEEDIKKFAESEPYAIAACQTTEPERFGVLSCENGFLLNINEKPDIHGTCLVNSGMYMLERDIFDAIRKTELSARGEYEITDSIKILMDSGFRVSVFQLSKWTTVTSPEDMPEAIKCVTED